MAYEFREVICPYCQHRYMVHKSEGGVRAFEYFDKITGKKIYSSRCTKCKAWHYMLENELEGIREDDDRVLEKGL